MAKNFQNNLTWIGILPIQCEDKMTVRVWDKPWSALGSDTHAEKYHDHVLKNFDLIVLPAECVHQEILENGKSAVYVVIVITVQLIQRGRSKKIPRKHIMFHTNDGIELSCVCKEKII